MLAGAWRGLCARVSFRTRRCWTPAMPGAASFQSNKHANRKKETDPISHESSADHGQPGSTSAAPELTGTPRLGGNCSGGEV
ncbi:hypothetical protein CSUI_002295, partial [Cystoisospora suis]